ncbi:hypothetical protein KP509_11G009200 [Ceratopteris richardii]|uniref:Uncharacterized protein n=1 Tax=Ceratopteris richardii TaxID=49495 RepID=A0A8T2TSN9_CERRI|nr:hypothetical protein KP509_11G009200 [Ceratopteris richardii]
MLCARGGATSLLHQIWSYSLLPYPVLPIYFSPRSCHASMLESYHASGLIQFAVCFRH